MKKAWVVLLLCVPGLVGCGADPEGGAARAGTPPVSIEGVVNDHGTSSASDRLELELGDFYFGPTYLRATPGQRFTIQLRNGGAAPHTFTIPGLDEEVQPGARRTVTVTAPQSGFVVVTCRYHVAQGMQGAIVVA